PEDDAGSEQPGQQQEDDPGDRISQEHVSRAGEEVEGAGHDGAAPLVGLDGDLLADALGGIDSRAADEDVHALRAERLGRAGVAVRGFEPLAPATPASVRGGAGRAPGRPARSACRSIACWYWAAARSASPCSRYTLPRLLCAAASDPYEAPRPASSALRYSCSAWASSPSRLALCARAKATAISGLSARSLS